MNNDNTPNEEFWFVDENFRILTGSEARDALKQTSDAPFLSENQEGIVKISPERWKIAQDFEYRSWMEKHREAKDDRNYKHMQDFENYQCLRGMTFRHAIEMGCGPFTNLRLIASVCNVQNVTLLDPLISSYLEHPSCFYTKEELQIAESPLSRSLSRSKLTRALRKIIRLIKPNLLGNFRLPIKQLIDKPIEEMPVSEKAYDLIVLINVIEHCYDIKQIFANILKIAAPGAILVFHDKYYYAEEVTQLVNGYYYEAGHPLMVDQKVLDQFLDDNFEAIYRKTLTKSNPTVKALPSYTGIFYIGKLKTA